MSAEPQTLSHATLPASAARVIVREQRGRLVLTFWSKTWDRRQELIADLRASFPGKREALYHREDGTWTFPPRNRDALQAWCCAWFEASAIDWCYPGKGERA